MTIQYAKALIGLCIDEGLKQGVLKNRGEFEELLDYLDKYFIDTGKMTSDSSEIQNDLEEAAEHYASVTDPEAHGIDFIREVFIAGEECQYQKDRAEFAKLKAKEWSDGYDEGIAKGKEQMISALKNDGDLPIEFIDKFHEIDRTAFHNGQANMKEQMLKEAVEGTVTCHNLNRYILVSGLDESLTYGDKVRIIILPKED